MLADPWLRLSGLGAVHSEIAVKCEGAPKGCWFSVSKSTIPVCIFKLAAVADTSMTSSVQVSSY